jgi:hypothetical protein
VPEPTPTNQPRQVAFDLPGYYVSGGNIRASAFFYAHSWPDGQPPLKISIQVNQAAPVEMEFAQATDEQKDFELPASALQETGNTAVLQIVESSTSTTAGGRRNLELCFEKLRIEYPRLYKADGKALSFVSPAHAGDDASTAVVAREYQVFGTAALSAPLVVDVTSATAPAIVPSQRNGDNLLIRVREAGARQYELLDVDNLAHAPLLPFTGVVDLQKPGTSGDYVIIAHPMFITAMQEFAERKRAVGHAVQIVDINDAYDQFAAGERVPQAIRAFLRYATANWEGSALAPAATYVLLAGDCSSDYRGNFRNNVYNYVPSMTAEENGDRFASDLWFGTSYGDDLLADNMIGRFSVNNVPDLTSILQKQRNYVEHPAPGPWRNTLAYIADHSDFEASVQNVMSNTVPSRFFLQRIFMSEQPWIDNYYFPLEVAEAKKSKVSPRTTALIRDMFNTGAAMVTYFGHGSPNVWSNERIWFGGDSENSDNRMLTNADKLSFIVNMTCNSGAIDYPMPRWNICISEDFMRITNGGAVACYVPSGPGITNQHERFTLELDRALLQERVAPLGPALALANWRYLLRGNPAELTRMFILMGDPELRLQLAEPARLDSAAADSAGHYQLITNSGEDYRAGEITTSTRMLSEAGNADAHDEKPFDAVALLPQNAPGERASSAQVALPSPQLEIIDIRRSPEGVVAPGREVQFAVRIRNTSKAAAKSARIRLEANGSAAGTSGEFSIFPGDEHTATVRMKAPNGLVRLRPVAVLDADVQELPYTDPLVLLASNRTSAGDDLLVDPQSLRTRYGTNADGLLAMVSWQTYNLSAVTMSAAIGELRTPDGAVVTSMPISAIGPGSAVLATANVNITTTSMPQRLSLVLTSGTVPVKQPHELQVTLAGAQAPDLLIPAGQIKVSSLSPSDGETVIFEVPVMNAGKTAAEGVNVEGRVGSETSTTQKLESRVAHQALTFTLEPQTSRVVHMRWDPFHNAGPQHIVFQVNSNSSADTHPENNVQALDLKVRTKAKVRPTNIRILEPTRDDITNRQIRLVATLTNAGETDAQGIRVVFYPTPRLVPKDAMGDAIIDVLPAGATRDATLVYKLKPGEETFPFRPSCETMLKGSLQRTPLSPSAPGS